MIVVDASVAMKWFVAEEGSDLALALLNSSESLLAPWVLRLEITNGLMRLYREQKLSEQATRGAIAELGRVVTDGGLQLLPNEGLWDATMSLMFKLKHPPADCLYLALGKATHSTVVTADDTLARRSMKSGAKAVLLGDYRVPSGDSK